MAARLTDFQESDLHSLREREREREREIDKPATGTTPQADGFGPVPEL